MNNQLPNSSTPLEKALANVAYDFSNTPTLLSIWNADTCPVNLLPYLAWALSVDEWDNTWSEGRKRTAIKAAREIHRHKGTPGGVLAALAALGQPDAEIIERLHANRHDGTIKRNGMHKRMGMTGWPYFRVILKRPVTIDQAYLMKRTLESVKRKAIWLTAIDFSQASLRHNGKFKRDGTYTRGVVNTTIS